MADSHCECTCPPRSGFQLPNDAGLPHFPPHVLTPSFWLLTALILVHTLACGHCTAWLQPHLTTTRRKRLAIAVYSLILAVALHEGFYILKADCALWAMVAGKAPDVVPHKGNLAQWVDWMDGVVASGIPIGLTLAIGWGIVYSLCGSLRELAGFRVQQAQSVVLDEKEKHDQLLD
ncbi:hypothetical protein BJX64DRAFT_264957 [Aspergillus heterothallicus]